MKLNVNFNQPKYVIGLMSYVGTLIIGGLVYWIIDTDIEKSKPTNLETKEYLNSNLPKANVRKRLPTKRSAVQDVYGNILDHSGISNIDNDLDSLRKKEDYASRYSEEELRHISEQEEKDEEIKRLREENARLQQSQGKPPVGFSESDFQLPLTDAERERLLMQRRRAQLSELSDELDSLSPESVKDSSSLGAVSDDERNNGGKAVKSLDESQASEDVVKKASSSSDYFNTLSENTKESNLIKAIVDEEIKVVEGSRVRLRILDDIMIGDIQIDKGCYLYATMSGFSRQRIQGSVSSVMVADEIYKINLSIYDMDGLEGLYVPSSAFRETAKEAAGGVMSQNMNINQGSSYGNTVAQWAMQGIQNTYQKTSNAISKAIRKNKVTIKYGTHVYLINKRDKNNK